MANSFLITDILFISLSVVILILTILTLTLRSFKTEYFKETKENYVMTPIFDLSLKTPLAFCPINQEVIPLGEWKGTRTGCDCIGLSAWRVPLNSYDRYTIGICTKDEYKGGCRTLPSTTPKNFTVWRGKEICGAYGTQSYEDYLKNTIGFNESCKANTHQCGIIDTLKQKLCLPNKQKCPINKLVFDDSPSPPKDFNYTTLSFGADNGYLHYTNEAIDNPILIKLKLSEGQICVNPNQYNTKYEKEQFILDEINDDYGCNDQVGNYTYDPRYTKLDQISKSILFPENEIYNFYGVNRGFPQKYSEQAKKAEILLYQRNFIGLNMTCIEESKLDHRNNDKRIAQNNKANNIHIANCVLISLLIGIIAIVLLCNFCNDGYSKEELSTSFFVVFGFYCLFLIPIFALALSSYFIFNGFHLEQTCGDDIFNNQLRIAQREIDLFEVIDVSISAFAILAILIFITLFIFLKKNSICSNISSSDEPTEPKIETENIIKEPDEEPLKENYHHNPSLLYPAPSNKIESTPLDPNDNKDTTKYQSGNYAI